jgi:hypothetical protein
MSAIIGGEPSIVDYGAALCRIHDPQLRAGGLLDDQRNAAAKAPFARRAEDG